MSEQKTTMIDIKRITQMLPHRYPILLVDRVLDIEPGHRAVALKNVTMNEPHFLGHFPGAPVMPGVLIVEAMAQTAAIVVIEDFGEEAEGKIVYFMTIDNARFRKPVVPGDALEIHVEKTQARRNVFKFKGKAMVDGVVAAEAEFGAMIADEAQV